MNIPQFVGGNRTTFKTETNDITIAKVNTTNEIKANKNTTVISTDTYKGEFWHSDNYDYYNLFYYKLYVGQEFNNIREICRFINIPYDRKNPNRSMKIIDKFYTFKKNDNGKLVVVKIKDRLKETIENVDFRTDKQTSEVMGNVLLTLIYRFSNENSIYTFFSYGQLYKLAQMCNEHYNEYEYSKDKRKELSLETEIEINVINDFIKLCSGVFKANVKKGIRNLNNRCLAFTTETYAICEKINGKLVHRLATDEEIEIILEHEYKALRSFRASTKKQIWEQHKIKEFYKKVANGIKSEQEYYNGDLTNIQYYYKCLKFIHCYENTVQDYMEQLEKKHLAESKQQSTYKVTNAKKYKENEEDMEVLKDKLID